MAMRIENAEAAADFLLQSGPGDLMGYVLTAGHDVDQDGTLDIVGAGLEGPDYFGGLWWVDESELYSPNPQRTLEGQSTLNTLGRSLASADGMLVAGAGDVFLFRSGWSDSLPDFGATAVLAAGNSFYGGSVAAGELIVGNGTVDFAALLPSPSIGEIHVFPGDLVGTQDPDDVAWLELRGATAYGLSIPGDVDGDGRGDLVFGSEPFDPYFRGWAIFLYNPIAGLLAVEDADASLEGEWRDNVGSEVVGAGDMDGDGAVDVAVGALQRSGYTTYGDGRVYLLTGAPLGPGLLATAEIKIEGEYPCDFGSDIAGNGDVDADGQDDLLLVGESGASGQAYLVHGPLQAGAYDVEDMATVRFDGNVGSSITAVSFAGDLDGDGTDDFVLGASSNSAPGAMYVYQGPW